VAFTEKSAGGYQYSKRYADPSPLSIAFEHARVAGVAHFHGIKVGIQRRADGAGFDFTFPDAANYGRFLLNAYCDKECTPGNYAHKENFPKKGDEAFQAAWTSCAVRAMNELGLPCSVETTGNDVRFRFGAKEHHAVFLMMRDSGMFNDMVDHPEEFPFSQPAAPVMAPLPC
jgi:hypothetical protein